MDIVEELRQDREAGAKRLESEYRAGLLAMARRLCSDLSDADELVNRTFAAVVACIDDYLEQSAFFGWMCRIMINLNSAAGPTVTSPITATSQKRLTTRPTRPSTGMSTPPFCAMPSTRFRMRSRRADASADVFGDEAGREGRPARAGAFGAGRGGRRPTAFSAVRASSSACSNRAAVCASE